MTETTINIRKKKRLTAYYQMRQQLKKGEMVKWEEFGMIPK